jgi:hypothetical protein
MAVRQFLEQQLVLALDRPEPLHERELASARSRVVLPAFCRPATTMFLPGDGG